MCDQDQRQQQQPAREPMTAARLAAMRERSEAALIREPVNTAKFAGMVASLEDVPDLLAFAEAALPILRAVAAAEDSDGPIYSLCYQLCDLSENYPHMDTRHDSPCIVTQARALLAGIGERAEGGE